MACVRKCRSNRLASRVHQNSPRTPLSASNHMMLRQRRCVARFQPQGRKSPLDSLRASAWPQRKDLRHSTSVWHRHIDRIWNT